MSEEQALIAALRANPGDEAARLVLADWLDEHNQPERAAWLRDPDVSQWMAPDYVTPVPALLAALGSDDSDGRLRDVFPKAGPGVVPALREAFAGADEPQRAIIADAFAALPVGPPRPLPELLEAVRSPDTGATRVAVAELGWHGPAAAPAVPRLVAAWHRLDPLDQRWEYRRGYCAEIARTLGRIGAAAASAAPVLMPCLDEDRSSIDFAHEALRAIGPGAAEVMFANLDRARPGSYWGVRVLAELALDPLRYVRPLLRGDGGRAADRVTAANVIGEHTWDERVAPVVPELIAALGSDDGALRAAAAGALGKIGTFASDAEPALRAALADPEPTVRLAAAEALSRFPAARAGFDAIEALLAAPATRDQARHSIWHRLDDAPEVLAALVRALRHPDPAVRRAFGGELPSCISVNAERVDFGLLSEALRDELPEVRRLASEILYRARAAALGAVPALLASLGDSDDETRKHVGYALGSGTMRRAPVVLEGLLAALRGPSPLARGHAAEILADRDDLPSDIGAEVAERARLETGASRTGLVRLLVKVRPLPAGAVGILRAVLGGECPEGRRGALGALAELGPRAADAVPDLIAMLGGEDEDQVRSVRLVLMAIGDAARGPLVPLLTGPRPELVSEAAFLFGEIGPPAETGDALVALVNGTDFSARWSATAALGKFPVPSSPPAGATAALLRAAREPGAELAKGALRALGHFGPAAREAFEDVLGLTYHEEAEVRYTAVFVLAKFGVPPGSVVPRLWELLTGPDEQLQWGAGWAAGDLGPGAARLVPELLARFTEESPRVKTAFAHALGRIGPAAHEAAEHLRARLSSEYDFTRLDAAAALVRVEPAAPDGLAVLRALFGTPEVDERYRFTAAAAVLEAEPGAPDALAALHGLLGDKNKYVVAEVRELLTRLGR